MPRLTPEQKRVPIRDFDWKHGEACHCAGCECERLKARIAEMELEREASCGAVVRGLTLRVRELEAMVAELEAEADSACARTMRGELADLDRYAPVIEAVRAWMRHREEWLRLYDNNLVLSPEATKADEAEYEARANLLAAARAAGMGEE